MEKVLIKCRMLEHVSTIAQEKKDKTLSIYKKCGPKRYGKQCPACEKGILCNRREYIMVPRCDECQHQATKVCTTCKWNCKLNDDYEEV